MTTIPCRTQDDPVLQVLDDQECLALVGSVGLGRIAFTEGALPAVLPVSFALVGPEVVFLTHPGSRMAGTSRGTVVAFEVDDIDVPAGTGWSVTIVGPSRLVGDTAEIAGLDALGVRPWPPADHWRYVGVQTALLRGSRHGPRDTAA